MTKAVLSATKIASYYESGCEKQLYYNSMEGTPYQNQIRRENPFRDRGFEWEETVKETLREKGYFLLNEQWEESASFEVKLNFVRRLAKQEVLSKLYLYDLEFPIPESLYNNYNLNKETFILKRIKPDVVEFFYNRITNEINIKIIDVKSSLRDKASQRVQVALYAFIFHLLVKEVEQCQNPSSYPIMKVNMNIGGIWLYGQDMYEEFHLEASLKNLDTFFSEELEHVLFKNKTDLYYHVEDACERCSFSEKCMQEAVAENHVSTLPFASPALTRYLANETGRMDTDTFQQYIGNHIQELEQNYLFQYKVPFLEAYANNDVNDRVKIIPHDIYPFPEKEDISIVINLQREGVSGTYPLLSFSAREVGQQDVQVAFFHHPLEYKERAIQFVEELMKHLVKYKQECKTVHFYFYDNEQYRWFIQFLRDLTIELRVHHEDLQRLMFLFLEPSSVEANTTTIKTSFSKDSLPYTIFTNLFSSAFVLADVRFHYDISTAISRFQEQLGVARTLSVINPAPKFVSNNLDASYIHRLAQIHTDEYIAYRRGKVSEVQDGFIEIDNYTMSYYRAVQQLVQIYRKVLPKSTSKHFFEPKGLLALPAPLDIDHEPLGRLLFIQYYENYLASKDYKNDRLLSLSEQIDRGLGFHLEYVKDGRFLVLNPEAIDVHHDASDYLIHMNNLHGWLAFNDRSPSSPCLKIGKASLETIDDDLYFTIKNDEKRSEFENIWQKAIESKQTFFTVKEDQDFTFPKVTLRLKRIGKELKDKDLRFPEERRQQNFTKYLLGPKDDTFEDQGLIPEPLDFVNVSKALLEQRFKHNLYQIKAYKQFSSQNLSCLWGPPGTGKTFFIGHALLTLSQGVIEKEKKNGQFILVSGATNEAVENCLQKVIEFLYQSNEYRSIKSKVHLYKMGSYKSNIQNKLLSHPPHYVTVLENFGTRNPGLKQSIQDEYDKMKAQSKNEVVILFSLPYQLEKAYDNRYLEQDDLVDTVIIDEASQCKISESLLLLSRAKAYNGRILLVGDNYQLPPVEKGEYPDNELMAKSVFDLFLARDKRNRLRSELKTNFRSNNFIINHSAEQIYGKEYVSEGGVKIQTLGVKDGQLRTEVLADALLDNANDNAELFVDICTDESPIVLCELNTETGEAISKGRKSDGESILIYQLVKHLVRHLNIDDEKVLETIFVVCPHKAQIRSLRKVFELRGDVPLPKIGTVEKMQGQEADIVIISYALSNRDLIAQEANFIYSLNRLNVAITRAKKKCILFLSEQMFTPHSLIELNGKYEEGIRYLQKLKSHIETMYSTHEEYEYEEKKYHITYKQKQQLLELPASNVNIRVKKGKRR